MSEGLGEDVFVICKQQPLEDSFTRNQRFKINSVLCQRKSSLQVLLLWAVFSSRGDWFFSLSTSRSCWKSCCWSVAQQRKEQTFRCYCSAVHVGQWHSHRLFPPSCFIPLGKKMWHIWRNLTMCWITLGMVQRKQKFWSETKGTTENLPFSKLCWGPLGHTS